MQTEQLLEKLFNNQPLDKAESTFFFTQVMQGKVSNEQLAGALIALKMRGETIDEISGAVTAALENAALFPTPDYDFADIVGTGGDGHNTINISTASAIVAATMGYKVAKHGSRTAVVFLAKRGQVMYSLNLASISKCQPRSLAKF